jgi:predicted transcriptional regulator
LLKIGRAKRSRPTETSMEEMARTDLVELTAEIISAYVSNNAVTKEDLSSIISDVHEALSKAAQRVGPVEREELRPAVALKKSVTPDYIICLEDGKKFKSLKRHLRTHYNLSPEEYREKWNLPHDYPMVAPNYAAARSNLAKQMGLGTRREK